MDSICSTWSVLLASLPVLTLIPLGASAQDSCGIDDIDRIRANVKSSSTDQGNLVSRRAALQRWWRLLWHQGYDMSAYNGTWNVVCRRGKDHAAQKAVDDGYAGLEHIMARGNRIPEVCGKSPAGGTTRTDWPVYHGTDASQTGWSPDKGPCEGKIAWRAPKGNFWHARPVIEGGKVYLASPGVDVIAYCLDERTGKVIWKGRQCGEDVYSTPGAIFTPVVTRDRVLVTTGWWQPLTHFVLSKVDGSITSCVPAGKREGGAPGEVTAFKFNRSNIVFADARTGRVIERFNAGGKMAGDPIIVHHRVYAALQNGRVFGFLDRRKQVPSWQSDLAAGLRGTPGIGKGRIYLGDTNRTLHALSESDGARKWSFQAQEIENKAYQYFSTAIEVNGKVYVGAASGYLYCLNAEDGSLVWKQRLSDWVRSRPIVLGDTVYVTTLDGKLYALRDNGASASCRWQTQVGEHGATADLAGNRNGILVSGRDLVLYSVSPETGKVQWRHSIIDGAWIDGVRYQADVYAGQFQTSPVVVDGVVYVGGPGGFLDALEVDTGKGRWRFETQGRISATPRVAEGKVFVGKNSHYSEFYAIDKETGEPVWVNDKVGWASVGATGYANGRVFVGTVSGRMYGIDASNGKIEWTYDAGPGKGFYPHPATDATKVYTGSHNGKYYAFGQARGDVMWETFTANPSGRGGKPDSAAPVLWKDHVYVQKGGSRIAALDRSNGQVAWEWKQPANYLQNGTVAAHNGKIYGSVVRLVTGIPYYAAIHAFSDVEGGGDHLWSYSDGGGGGGLTAPVVADGKLIFGSSAGVFVTCVNADSGSLIWRCYVGGPMEEGVPAVYGDKVFVHCRNGYFFAIR